MSLKVGRMLLKRTLKLSATVR